MSIRKLDFPSLGQYYRRRSGAKWLLELKGHRHLKVAVGCAYLNSSAERSKPLTIAARGGGIVSLLILITFAITQVVHAATTNFSDFCSISSLTLSGSTASNSNPVSTSDGCVLRLTTGLNQSGGAFLTDAISLGSDAGFSTAFSFRISSAVGVGDTDGPGADGLVFVVQTQSNQFGGTGVGLGYSGLDKSLGVEFDTFLNTSLDSDGNHVGST